ncbi:MAG TPA: hypothetical protein VHZ81_06805 [Galbitalea sp.]|nr:hypothetical protein [Galbitalea sp.]
MSDKNPRQRKPVSAARIQLELWFADLATYQSFARVQFGRYSRNVTDRKWVSAQWDSGNLGIDAVFQFTHTCRNDGAQRGDSEKFFNATCRAAGIDLQHAGVVDVELLSRDKISA